MIAKKVTVNGISYFVKAGWEKGPVLPWEFHVEVTDQTGNKNYDIPVHNGGSRRQGCVTLPFQSMPS